jgi:transcriptional regulator with XRE-family HTH domain
MDNNFLNRLKEVRKYFGLSGYSFAKKLNIPQPTYLRYETGEQKPSGRLIKALVLECGINAYWLYTGLGAMFYDAELNSGNRQNDTSVEEKLSGFGRRLSQLQEQHNFLDREMAILLQVSERQYVSLVAGSKIPDIAVLNKIKQNFKVSIDYLLYGE